MGFESFHILWSDHSPNGMEINKKRHKLAEKQLVLVTWSMTDSFQYVINVVARTSISDMIITKKKS